MRKRNLAFILASVLVFVILIDAYYLRSTVASAVTSGAGSVGHTVDNLFVRCDGGEILVRVPDGHLCRAADIEPSPLLDIYDTYPKSIHGKEAIYSSLSEGTLTDADLLVDGIYPVPRFDPVELGTYLTWTENPYTNQDWRLSFYSLSLTQHLIYAGSTTGRAVYYDALINLVESFIDRGMGRERAWESSQGAAIRTMVLVNVWWKLREQDALPPEISHKILRALEQHGVWLVEEMHPGSDSYDDSTEAAALFLLSQTFPDLPGARQWDAVSRERLAELLTLIVNEDGVQAENSPYYHFYFLEKFWGLHEYIKRYNIVPPTQSYDERLSVMVHYATHILQPDLSVPPLGASTARSIPYTGTYASIASANPGFEYVLSQGASGKEPPVTDVHYPAVGQTVMRSGWGVGKEFVNQTQVIFGIGAYRAPHSDLDAMNFTLYSNGAELIVDSGFSASEENKYRRYFQSTAAHNTVVVDGSDQRPGRAAAGELIQGDGYAVQTASHNLYTGVVHNRALALLGHDFVLIVDYLVSSTEHDYSQMFHFAPGATFDVGGEVVTAQLQQEDQRVTIHQLSDQGVKVSRAEGEVDPPAGLCSSTYGGTQSCAQVSYQQHAATGVFITLLEIGKPDEQLTAEVSTDFSAVTIRSSERDYDVQLDWPDIPALLESVAAQTETSARYDGGLSFENGRWMVATSPDAGERYTVEVTDGEVDIVGTGPELRQFDVTIEGVNTYSSAYNKVRTDLPASPAAAGTFRIYEQEDYLPIFGYHYVIPDSQEAESSYDMHLSDFVRKVDFTTNVLGCRWYTLADIVENYVLREKKIPYRACVMTFDDGLRNNYEKVFPVLRDFDAVASFYILPGRIGRSERYMTWEQVDEIYRYGNEIGSHAVTSGGLIDAGWNHEQLAYEIGASKRMLDDYGYNARTFAYPLGQYNDEIIGLVQQSGYIAGRSSEKDHRWLDRRAQTVSMTGAHLWTMAYARGDVRSLGEIEHDFGYNTWWQFEEGYAVTRDDNQDVTIRSSDKPTATSYAVLELQDQSDAVTNKFLVAHEGVYTFEIYAVTGRTGESDTSRLHHLNIYVDDKPRPTSLSPDPGCKTVDWRRYCTLLVVDVPMTEGAHTITVEAANERGAIVDKFRLYRELVSQPSYQIQIVERVPYGFVQEELQIPEQIRVAVEAGPTKAPMQSTLGSLLDGRRYLWPVVIAVGIGILILVYVKVRRRPGGALS